MGALKSFQEILDQEIKKHLEPESDSFEKPIGNFKNSESMFLKKLSESLGPLSPSKIFVQKSYTNSQKPTMEPKQESPKVEIKTSDQISKPPQAKEMHSATEAKRVKRAFTFDQANALKLFNSHGYQLDEWSTDNEIKRAYRFLAKRFHPDRLAQAGQKEKRSAEEVFKSIARAFSYFDI